MTPFLGPNRGQIRALIGPPAPPLLGVYRGPSRGLFMGPGRGQSRALIDPPGLPFGGAIGVPFGYFQWTKQCPYRPLRISFGEAIEAPVM